MGWNDVKFAKENDNSIEDMQAAIDVLSHHLGDGDVGKEYTILWLKQEIEKKKLAKQEDESENNNGKS